jgi:hypothetical protein
MHTSIRVVSTGAVLLGMGVFINWLGCGGTPSPKGPGDLASAGGTDTSAPTSTDTGGSTSPSTTSTPDAPSTTTAPPPPPAPTFADTDCGKCIATECKKQGDACAKDTECKALADSVNSCTASNASGMSDCVSKATAPTKAAGKKAAKAWNDCAGKVTKTGKCKDTCK